MRERPGPWPSVKVALYSDAALRNIQQSELRCIRLAVRYGLPVDDTCLLVVDRLQDEIQRRHELGGA